MINNLTEAATLTNNNFSDTQMGGTGIGQSNANINLDAGRPPIEDRTPPHKEYTPKKETTQGQHQVDLENTYNEIDQINEILNSKNNMWLKALNSGLITEKDYNDLINKPENKNKNINDIIKDFLNNKKAELYNNIDNIKKDTTYDNRTDEQVREDNIRENIEDREDNAYQRAVEDLRKAGVNPAIMYGGAAGAGGGGIGGGSSSKSEEEEKKRRKKKEEEERARIEAERMKQQQIMQMLGMMGGAASLITMQSMRNRGAIESAKVQRTYTRMSQSEQEKRLRATLNEYYPD